MAVKEDATKLLVFVSVRRMVNEKELIKHCLNNQPKAQKQLYDLYSGLMLGVCFRYTKSEDDAQEILQMGFIKVFKSLGQYKGEGELGAWIRRIMVNTAINYLKRKPRYQLDLAFEDQRLHPVEEYSALDVLNQKDLLNKIRQLPAGYQTIFNLHAVEGYPHVEIAKMLGINEGTSRSQYARARALLISWLEKKNDQEKNNRYAR